MSSGPFGGWHPDQLLHDQSLVYHEVEPVRRTGPIVTLAGLTLGLLGGIVLGYMLHMAVHGV